MNDNVEGGQQCNTMGKRTHFSTDPPFLSVVGKGRAGGGATALDPQVLNYRRALAEKLKNEVVGK
jgi:hypothetical protein